MTGVGGESESEHLVQGWYGDRGDCRQAQRSGTTVGHFHVATHAKKTATARFPWLYIQATIAVELAVAGDKGRGTGGPAVQEKLEPSECHSSKFPEHKIEGCIAV